MMTLMTSKISIIISLILALCRAFPVDDDSQPIADAQPTVPTAFLKPALKSDKHMSTAKNHVRWVDEVQVGSVDDSGRLSDTTQEFLPSPQDAMDNDNIATAAPSPHPLALLPYGRLLGHSSLTEDQYSAQLYKMKSRSLFPFSGLRNHAIKIPSRKKVSGILTLKRIMQLLRPLERPAPTYPGILNTMASFLEPVFDPKCDELTMSLHLDTNILDPEGKPPTLFFMNPIIKSSFASVDAAGDCLKRLMEQSPPPTISGYWFTHESSPFAQDSFQNFLYYVFVNKAVMSTNEAFATAILRMYGRKLLEYDQLMIAIAEKASDKSAKNLWAALGDQVPKILLSRHRTSLLEWGMHTGNLSLIEYVRDNLFSDKQQFSTTLVSILPTAPTKTFEVLFDWVQKAQIFACGTNQELMVKVLPSLIVNEITPGNFIHVLKKVSTFHSLELKMIVQMVITGDRWDLFETLILHCDPSLTGSPWHANEMLSTLNCLTSAGEKLKIFIGTLFFSQNDKFITLDFFRQLGIRLQLAVLKRTDATLSSATIANFYPTSDDLRRAITELALFLEAGDAPKTAETFLSFVRAHIDSNPDLSNDLWFDLAVADTMNPNSLTVAF